MEHLRLPKGLSIRPSTANDQGFIENLYRTTRDDLRAANAESDYIETIIESQFHAQTCGYGDMFPNAMYFIVAYHGQSVGRITIDFGPVEIRVVDIALIREARGKGYGGGIITALQYAAGKARVPLALSVLSNNIAAKNLYRQLGFCVAEVAAPYERMVWYPSNEFMFA